MLQINEALVHEQATELELAPQQPNSYSIHIIYVYTYIYTAAKPLTNWNTGEGPVPSRMGVKNRTKKLTKPTYKTGQ